MARIAGVHRRDVGFVALAGAVLATALVLSTTFLEPEGSGALAAGITLDLTILVPAAFYFLVVRPRGWPPVAVAPVIALGLLTASLVLPADHQGALGLVKALAIPVEVGLLGWIGVHAVRAMRRAGRDGGADPVEVLQHSARGFLRVRRPADVLASELAVFFYALGAWRRAPHTPADARAFSSHRRSGLGGLVFAVLLLTAVEVLAVHFLVAHWSATVAWVVTVVSLYGALWILADYRATVLRPLLVDAGGVWLRAGLRWRVRVPRERIARVSRRDPGPEAGAVSLAFMTAPNLWIEFTEPLPLTGAYGLQRRARWVGAYVDEPAELERALGVG